jgi:hypothetical protein
MQGPLMAIIICLRFSSGNRRMKTTMTTNLKAYYSQEMTPSELLAEKVIVAEIIKFIYSYYYNNSFYVTRGTVQLLQVRIIEC